MSAADIIRIEEDQSLSFGNHHLVEKAKVEDFAYQGDLLKVKTYKTMTKLEKNGMFLYESVPGTSVENFRETEEGMSFQVEAAEDISFTLELEPSQEYKVMLDGMELGKMKTNLGGKLNVSLELDEGKQAEVKVSKC